MQNYGDMKVGTVVVLVAAIVFLYKLYVVAKNKIIERYEAEGERENKLQSVLEQASHYPECRKQSLDAQKNLTAAIKEIEKSNRDTAERLNGIITLIGENEATMSRYRILRFNDEILHDKKHTKEHFDQILDDITRYEKYCEEHPEYENNKAVLAIANIEAVYRECGKENKFL